MESSSIWNDVPLTTCHQSRAINHVTSTTCHQPRVINHVSSTTCHQPRVINHVSSTTCHQSRAISTTCHQPRVNNQSSERATGHHATIGYPANERINKQRRFQDFMSGHKCFHEGEGRPCFIFSF